MIYNLDNFEEQFSEKTLNNGLKLFKSSYTQITKERTKVRIEYKKTIFSIIIKRNGNKIHANCSCTKSKCEHIASLLFFLNKDKFNLIIKSDKNSRISSFHQTSKFKPKLTIPELLADLDRKKLLLILNEIALKNEKIDTQLRAKYATIKNHTALELLELKIQDAVFDRPEFDETTTTNLQLLVQSIIKLKTNYSDSGVVKFYFDCVHILFNIYSKTKKQWLKDVIEIFCEETFTKVPISDLKSTTFRLTDFLENYERKHKPNPEILINRFYIRFIWAANINHVIKLIPWFEQKILKQKQIWPEAKVNLTILQFILLYKKGTTKKVTEINHENKLAAVIALFELDPKKAELILLEILNNQPNDIFNIYSISSRIYKYLKTNSFDHTLKIFLLKSFKMGCEFNEDYLSELDRLCKNNNEKLLEITSVIDFWLSFKDPIFINPILGLSCRYKLKEATLKILKSNIVPYTSFKKLLWSNEYISFKEIENLFIESIIRKVNQITSNHSHERILLDLKELITHLNIVNDKLFYKNLYNKRMQYNYFFKLVEKELN